MFRALSVLTVYGIKRASRRKMSGVLYLEPASAGNSHAYHQLRLGARKG